MSTKEILEAHGAADFAAGILIDILRQRVEKQRDERIYLFLADGEVESDSLTYGELDREARAIGRMLQEAGAAGRPVLLVYPPGLRFIGAFFGCLYAGAIPTPAYPPASNKNALRLWSIIADSQPAMGLTTTTILDRTQRSAQTTFGLQTLNWLVTDRLDYGLAQNWREPSIQSSATALLQYTSGSTANPKGVMITHANLLHNQRLICDTFGQTEESVIVSWLPLYHDMGLIGAVLQPVYVGAQCILMPPAAFLQSPFLWLKAISRYKATTSGGPNFAFDLCARKITAEQKQNLDLSSWKVAFNGAEPVLAETLDRFSAVFKECGFRSDAFRPCYGLAEATLLVSASTDGGASIRAVDARAMEHGLVTEPLNTDSARRLVASGEPVSAQTVLIVEPETRTPCAPGRIGEIWVSGQSVSHGYWNRPEDTQKRLRARLSNDDARTFLCTGDLGFLDQGRLFVTGRVNELIIIQGLNYYPLDLEMSAQRTDSAIRPGCGAAFSIDLEGHRRVVLVQEIERNAIRNAEALLQPIRASIANDHELALHAVVLVHPHTLPKTSSGKIRRRACRDQFMHGGLKVIAQWSASNKTASTLTETSTQRSDAPRTTTENLLVQIWSEVLRARLSWHT